MLQKVTNYPNFNEMKLKRMGSRYPSRLSFSRSMLRTMVKEKWRIVKKLENVTGGTAVKDWKSSARISFLPGRL